MALAGETAGTVTVLLRWFLTFILGGEKRFLEHVKKLVLSISAPRIFNDLHCE
jgi:hypothetical protein